MGQEAGEVGGRGEHSRRRWNHEINALRHITRGQRRQSHGALGPAHSGLRSEGCS